MYVAIVHKRIYTLTFRYNTSGKNQQKEHRQWHDETASPTAVVRFLDFKLIFCKQFAIVIFNWLFYSFIANKIVEEESLEKMNCRQ